METIVLSAQDCPKGGWPVPGMLAWQGDGYSLRQTSSDLSEQMHAIGGFYLPPDILPYRSHIITEKHFSIATSMIESRLSSYNHMKYPTARTWYRRTPSFQMKHQSRDINWDGQDCRSGSALCAQTITKARNYEIMGQVICRYSSSCLVSRKSLEGVLPKRNEQSTSLPRANLLTHSLQQPKTSKQSSNKGITGHKERAAPAPQEFSLCKDSVCVDDCATGILYVEGDAHVIPFELLHNRLAIKAPQSAEKIDCNMPQTVSLKRYEILSNRANCVKKYGGESMDDAAPGWIKVGQGGECSSLDVECSSLDAGKAKAIMCDSSSTNSKMGTYKDHGNGLMPFDSVVTSASTTSLAVKAFSQESSQSAHPSAMNERWAGPAFSNSPPPSSLPVPSFTRRQSRTSSLEIPRAQAEFLADSICILAPGTPSHSFSLPNAGGFPSHLDTNHATQNLRRLLNLDSHT